MLKSAQLDCEAHIYSIVIILGDSFKGYILFIEALTEFLDLIEFPQSWIKFKSVS